MKHIKNASYNTNSNYRGQTQFSETLYLWLHASKSVIFTTYSLHAKLSIRSD